MNEPLRGVNLGGWLVLEKWMTPTLFRGTGAVDEYTFMQTKDAREKLREHQRTFITEEDFKWMRDHGVNAVRIPIGYWIFEGDKPYVSCIGKLDWAVRMAEKYGILVLICMHGAPGSQNGNDHSGRIGAADWYDSESYRAKTIEVLKRLAIRYYDSKTVWGIQLLNEPKTKIFQGTLRKFYKDAYDELRQVGRPGLVIVYHDAFSPRWLSGALWPHSNFPVVLDHHWYHFFIPGRLQSLLPWRFYAMYMWWKGKMLRSISRTQPVIIGEWNGIIGGERLNKYPESEHAQIIDTHIRQQIDVYEGLLGWFYWSYKHEAGGVFNFRDMVENGRIAWSDTPKNIKNRIS